MSYYGFPQPASVHVDNPLTGFGEVITAVLTPLVQVSFIYGINNDLIITGSNGSAYVTESNLSFVKIGTGAGADQSASLATKKILKYYPGQGSLARYTTVYSTPTMGSIMQMGLVDDYDGIAFGYSGSHFGIMRWYNGTLAEFVSQSAWNIDTMDGSGNPANASGIALNPQTGNVYQVQLQYLGFGNINFYIENSVTGHLEPVHRIKYPNTFVTTSLANPTLPISAMVKNTTNNTDVWLMTPSIAGFVEGTRRFTGPVNSEQGAVTVTTEQSVFTIRNKTTYNNRRNKVRIYLRAMTLTTDANTGTATIRIVSNGTLSPTGSYTDISPNSVIEVAPSGSSVSGGRTLGRWSLASRAGATEDLQSLEFEIPPGDTITIAAGATNSNLVSATLSWVEDF